MVFGIIGPLCVVDRICKLELNERLLQHEYSHFHASFGGKGPHCVHVTGCGICNKGLAEHGRFGYLITLMERV